MKRLPEDFILAFNTATGLGLKHIEEIVTQENYKEYDLHTYYTQNIDYNLDAEKLNALTTFLSKLSN